MFFSLGDMSVRTTLLECTGDIVSQDNIWNINLLFIRTTYLECSLVWVTLFCQSGQHLEYSLVRAMFVGQHHQLG